MGTYISTGTAGQTWMVENCERCARDNIAEDIYCPVLTALQIGEYPIEGLIEHHDRLWPRTLECTYFTPKS